MKNRGDRAPCGTVDPAPASSPDVDSMPACTPEESGSSRSSQPFSRPSSSWSCSACSSWSCPLAPRGIALAASSCQPRGLGHRALERGLPGSAVAGRGTCAEALRLREVSHQLGLFDGPPGGLAIRRGCLSLLGSPHECVQRIGQVLRDLHQGDAIRTEEPLVPGSRRRGEWGPQQQVACSNPARLGVTASLARQ